MSPIATPKDGDIRDSGQSPDRRSELRDKCLMRRIEETTAVVETITALAQPQRRAAQGKGSLIHSLHGIACILSPTNAKLIV